MLNMPRETGEKQPETDKQNRERFANSIEAAEGHSRRWALSPDDGSIEQPLEQHKSEYDATGGDESE
jgi:hypothetical protein